MTATVATDLVKIELNGSVLELVLNRPDKKNALTLDMYETLTRALVEAGENPDISAVLLFGEGPSFSSGNDIGEFIAVATSDNNHALKTIIGFIQTLASFPKPIIAAVHGDAVGIGTTIMLHCDLVLVAENLRAQMPFVKLGLVPEAGSTLLVPNLIGHRKAFQWLVEGSVITATEAVTEGLANSVCNDDELINTARTRAQNVAQLPQESVKLSKQLLKKTYLKQLQDIIDEEGDLFYQRLSSAEAKQAFMSFISKGAR